MKNITIAEPITGIASRPAFTRADSRVRPPGIIHDSPNRRPAPAERTIAVNSNGP
jgi:hypothetical protein